MPRPRPPTTIAATQQQEASATWTHTSSVGRRGLVLVDAHRSLDGQQDAQHRQRALHLDGGLAAAGEPPNADRQEAEDERDLGVAVDPKSIVPRPSR